MQLCRPGLSLTASDTSYQLELGGMISNAKTRKNIGE